MLHPQDPEPRLERNTATLLTRPGRICVCADAVHVEGRGSVPGTDAGAQLCSSSRGIKYRQGFLLLWTHTLPYNFKVKLKNIHRSVDKTSQDCFLKLTYLSTGYSSQQLAVGPGPPVCSVCLAENSPKDIPHLKSDNKNQDSISNGNRNKIKWICPMCIHNFIPLILKI